MKNKHLCSAASLKAELDDYVIGQDKGVRRIATVVASHLARLKYNREHPDTPIRKENALLIGPSGSGKTETFRCLKRLEKDLGVPIIMRGALDFSPNGSWKGTPVATILKDVKDAAERLFREVHPNWREEFWDDSLEEVSGLRRGRQELKKFSE